MNTKLTRLAALIISLNDSGVDSAGLTGLKLLANMALEEDQQRDADTLAHKFGTYHDDPERQWVEFWRDIVAPGGNLDVEQVKKELSDFSMLMAYASKVYEHATGGMVSKLNTCPSTVCNVIDDHITDLVDDDVKDQTSALHDQVRQLVAALQAAHAKLEDLKEYRTEWADMFQQIDNALNAAGAA